MTAEQTMCDDCDWQEHVERIDELLAQERAEFASDTLEGIREWVVQQEHITPKQVRAIDNIAEFLDREERS